MYSKDKLCIKKGSGYGKNGITRFISSRLLHMPSGIPLFFHLVTKIYFLLGVQVNPILVSTETQTDLKMSDVTLLFGEACDRSDTMSVCDDTDTDYAPSISGDESDLSESER